MATHRIRPDVGPTLAQWSDDDVANASRLNPGARALAHWRVVPTATCDASAVLLADEAVHADADLGGQLYQWSWGIVPPGLAMPSLALPIAGTSATVRWTFGAQHVGLWLLTCVRHGHGSACLPIEVAIA